MGYYPIIVTRNWDIPIKHSRDEYKKTGNKIIHEKKGIFEVFYLPFIPTFKNRLFEKFYGSKFYFLYLITALFYGIGENLSSCFTPYKPLYSFCKKLLSENKDISLMLISGSPFHLFKFGYKLRKDFGIRWIADYRDDWNTNELFKSSRSKRILQKISERNEIKWVNSAEFFISVSDHYVNKISKLLGGLPGYTILNGFLSDNYKGLIKCAQDHFTIAYVGSLYPNQPIQIFIEAYKRFIDNTPEIKSKVIFVGLAAQPSPLEKIKRITQHYERFFEYTLRISKKDAINIQYNASVLLMVAYGNLKGIPGSKLYEFIALHKPVLVCPSDKGIIQKTLTETGQGYFANNVHECYEMLNKLYSEYGKGFSQAKKINKEKVANYSRYKNVKKFSLLLDKILFKET